MTSAKQKIGALRSDLRSRVSSVQDSADIDIADLSEDALEPDASGVETVSYEDSGSGTNSKPTVEIELSDFGSAGPVEDDED